jgi:acetyl-CoA C-acetyltransferase
VNRSVIVAAVRTPFGRFGGGLAKYEATQLGAIAIKAALERVGLEANEPEYVIMGQVLQAGAGQAPARQAAVGAGLPVETPADTINKVCASSIRAIEIADAMIRAG